ncbi:MAG TPA: enolase C-terminal domain-like protein [Thermomicrobiales bacterium]|nr:enolase C-terminal domain-like protein [Thermomicrobiales bacterium]
MTDEKRGDMKISAVDAFVVDIPFRTPFVVWRGTVPSKQHVLVRITTDDGIEGWGEAAPFLYYAPETAADVFSFISGMMRDELVGREFIDVRSMLRPFAMLDGHEFARAAVETALWDGFGKRYGLPIYRLLGGAAHDSVPVLTVLHVSDPAEMADEAEALVAGGLRRLKLKIGFGVDADEEMVARVRERVGPAIAIRADAEESYTPKTALRVGRRLEKYDLELLSQPVARTDWEGMAFLRRSLALPILADEGIHSAHDVLTCIRAGAADMVNIKVLKSGGATEALAMGALCAAAHLPVVIGSMIESGIGTLMGAHVAKALPPVFSTELCGPFLLADDLLSEPLHVRDGSLIVPDVPGLGATVDQEKLERYRAA